jgi:hypothetical protein
VMILPLTVTRSYTCGRVCRVVYVSADAYKVRNSLQLLHVVAYSSQNIEAVHVFSCAGAFSARGT